MISHTATFALVAFGIATLASVALLAGALRGSTTEGLPRGKLAIILPAIALWLTLQGMLAAKGVYALSLGKSPPMLFRLGLLPALAVITVVFLSQRGRAMAGRISLRRLTLTSVVRVPVELALFGLYLQGQVPRLMTFEGGNLDILAGLSALPIAWLAFHKEELVRPRLLLAWNVICLGLLANIVVRALLSAPLPFQKLAFDQPNVAILHFPFIWLPVFIVPVVLFSHLASILKLTVRPRLPLAGAERGG